MTVDITSQEMAESSLPNMVRDVVRLAIDEGKPVPRIVVFDATAHGTNWMPRVVCDVTGQVGQPIFCRTYVSLDGFAEREGPDPNSLAGVRRDLDEHPDEIVAIVINDHGQSIVNMVIEAEDGGSLAFKDLQDLQFKKLAQSKYAALSPRRRRKLDHQVTEVFVRLAHDLHDEVDDARERFDVAMKRVGDVWGKELTFAACCAHMQDEDIPL